MDLQLDGLEHALACVVHLYKTLNVDLNIARFLLFQDSVQFQVQCLGFRVRKENIILFFSECTVYANQTLALKGAPEEEGGLDAVYSVGCNLHWEF